MKPETVYVLEAQFPARVTSTLCLLRRRVGLSREVVVEVVQARGRVAREYGVHYYGMIVSRFDGKQHGFTRQWWSNGTLASEAIFIDGKLHGVDRGWYENSMLHWEIPYVNDKRHGFTRWWSDNGVLSLENIV